MALRTLPPGPVGRVQKNPTTTATVAFSDAPESAVCSSEESTEQRARTTALAGPRGTPNGTSVESQPGRLALSPERTEPAH